MLDFLRTNEAQAVILISILLIISAVGLYLVARFRDQNKGEETANKLLVKFGEMHDRGELSRAEYRTIKAMLADQLQEKLSGKDETG